MAWEGWVLLHVLVAWSMPSFLAALSQPPPDMLQPAHGSKFEQQQQGWQLLLQQLGVPVYHTLMALVIPASIGYAPFSRRLTLGRLWHVLVAMQ